MTRKTSASVTERAETRHGLEPLAREAKKSRKTATELRIRGDLGHLNLRGRADDEFVQACERVLGQPLPVRPNSFTEESARVYWLGPDEWLVVGETGRVDALAAELEASLAGRHAAVNRLGGGQIALELSGEHCRNLLAKGCTLDFHPRVFRAGHCAQSGLARANVLIGCLGDGEGFELIVRRSFADYLVRWLSHAGADHGLRVVDA